MHADRLVNEALTSVDARKWHYAVLAALEESGPASQALLSRRAGLYHSDLVGILNELADRGFVDRTPDAADRRRNVVTITQQGRRQLRRLDKVLAAVQDELLASLTASERQQLTGILTRLLDQLHETSVDRMDDHAGTGSRPAAPATPRPKARTGRGRTAPA
jgi:DNA-binding MarR family transcriptional regulator